MRVLLFLTLFAAFACNNHPDEPRPSDDSTALSPDTAKSQPKELIFQPTDLETEVNAFLVAKNKSAWTVVNDTVAKWPKDMFDYFIAGKRQADPNYPYIVGGDFNANGKQDIAALVTNSSGDMNKVAIIIDSANLQFWEDDVRGAAISIHPKKDVGDIYGKTAKLLAEGINVEFFEKSSWVLYWNGKQFKKAWTGD